MDYCTGITKVGESSRGRTKSLIVFCNSIHL